MWYISKIGHLRLDVLPSWNGFWHEMQAFQQCCHIWRIFYSEIANAHQEEWIVIFILYNNCHTLNKIKKKAIQNFLEWSRIFWYKIRQYQECSINKTTITIYEIRLNAELNMKLYLLKINFESRNEVV